MRDCDVLWFLPFYWGYLLNLDEVMRSDKDWNQYVKILGQSKIFENHSCDEVNSNGVPYKSSGNDNVENRNSNSSDSSITRYNDDLRGRTKIESLGSKETTYKNSR